MGRQDTTLTVDQQKMLEGVIGNPYCDNICAQVVSEHSDRIELKRITSADDATQKWIDKYWQKGKWDDLQNRIHRNTVRDGNFCVMVEYSYQKQKILIHREKWWDGQTGVFIGYDAYGEMLYAVKEWETPTGRRRTVYYDAFIERYISQGGSNVWLPFVLPSDTTTSGLNGGVNLGVGAQPEGTLPIAIPYVDEDGQPLHIPFIHFQNPGDEFENYGMSILDGGFIGGQDHVNDITYDILSTCRMNGYQREWSKGFKLKKINGKSVEPKKGPGIIYHADEDTAAWGVLAAGSIEELIKAYDTKIKSLCRMSQTPYASISGNWPSGEAVYKLEQPIRGRTKARQKRFAPCWVEVMHRCIELANTFGNANLDEEAMLTTIFADAGDRDPLALAIADLSFWQAASAAVSAGLPLEVFLRESGWGEESLKGISTQVATQVNNPTPTPGNKNPVAGKGSNTKPNTAPGNKK